VSEEKDWCLGSLSSTQTTLSLNTCGSIKDFFTRSPYFFRSKTGGVILHKDTLTVANFISKAVCKELLTGGVKLLCLIENLFLASQVDCPILVHS
jgi:hypothetical protein